jgi:hypothetical protein
MLAPRLAALACAGGLALAGVLASAAPAAEPAAREHSVNAEEAGTAATFRYEEGIGGALPYFDLKLQIALAGKGVLYEQPIGGRYCGHGCVPEPLGSGPVKSSPLTVSDLEMDDQPDVVLELSTGGAHCCTVVQVFTYDPGVMAYRTIERDFGDPGALLVSLEKGGAPEFESADDNFAYEFAPYAFSGLPVQIWSFHEGRFVNVTRSYPAVLEGDAAHQFRGFLATRHEGEGLGLIAAWAADEYLLDHRSLVSRTLAREARHGRLHSHERYGPSGRAFIAKLTRFLKHDGYG